MQEPPGMVPLPILGHTHAKMRPVSRLADSFLAIAASLSVFGFSMIRTAVMTLCD